MIDNLTGYTCRSVYGIRPIHVFILAQTTLLNNYLTHIFMI